MYARPALAQTPATFATPVVYSAGTAVSQPYSIAVADVNGDGKPDILTASLFSNTAGVLLGTGTDSFGAYTFYGTGTDTRPSGIAVADVNGDGKPDLLTSNQGTGTIRVMLNTTLLTAVTTTAFPTAQTSVYPNPATGYLTLESAHALVGQPYTVSDCLGRVLLHGAIVQETQPLDLSSLSAGVYLVQVGEKTKQSLRVVKQ